MPIRGPLQTGGSCASLLWQGAGLIAGQWGPRLPRSNQSRSSRSAYRLRNLQFSRGEGRSRRRAPAATSGFLCRCRMLAVRRARALFTQPTRTMSTTQALPKQDDANDKPWYAAFPAPLRSVAEGTLATMSAQELRQRLLDGPKEDDLLVVDVRRTDFEVCRPFVLNLWRGKACCARRRRLYPSVVCPQQARLTRSIPPAQTAFIKGAINLPAHSFYQTLPSLVPILSRCASRKSLLDRIRC